MAYTTQGSEAERDTGAGEQVWRRILRASMALPGAKVNREQFLRSQLWNHCDELQVREAIETRPAAAGIPNELIDRIADSCIRASRYWGVERFVCDGGSLVE